MTVQATFSDPDASDTHTSTINWGDGTTTNATVDQVNGTATGTHQYATVGVFIVSVIVTDAAGELDTETTMAVVTGVRLTDDGELQIVGTDGKDKIHVRQHGQKIKVHAKFNGGSDQHFTFNKSDVDSLLVYTCDGDDHVHIGHGHHHGNGGCHGGGSDGGSDGGRGRDYLRGGQGDDFIDGGEGNDWISSRRGDDTIVDPGGDNRIWAGSGNDTVTTGSGNDQIHADGGNDTIDVGDGRNKVWAGDGDDTVVAGVGNDWIGGGHGNDVILAGAGNDDIDAGHGNDIVVGGAGDDWIVGGKGHDLLIGGAGKDKMKGDGGHDLMIGHLAANQDNLAALDAALAKWLDDDLPGALAALGTLTDDGVKDILKGGKGDDELIGGVGDKLKP